MACDATVTLRYEKIAETEDGPEFMVISGPSLVSVIIQSSGAARRPWYHSCNDATCPSLTAGSKGRRSETLPLQGTCLFPGEAIVVQMLFSLFLASTPPSPPPYPSPTHHFRRPAPPPLFHFPPLPRLLPSTCPPEKVPESPLGAPSVVFHHPQLVIRRGQLRAIFGFGHLEPRRDHGVTAAKRHLPFVDYETELRRPGVSRAVVFRFRRQRWQVAPSGL